MNILFSYCYRDAGNNKKYGECVFENRQNIALEFIQQQIRNRLIDGEFFTPESWGIARLSFDSYDSSIDHEWHEFISVELAALPATEKMDIENFLTELKNNGTLCV